MTTMHVAIKPVDDGPLDFNLKAGDIVKVFLDGESIGNQEKKSYCVVAMDYPTNVAGNEFPLQYMEDLQADMQIEEYGPGATTETNVIRRARKYSIPSWDQRFDAEELVTIRSATAFLADGDTSQGGTVASGIVSGLFSFSDIVRK